jgi:ribosomal protein S18 acetylase RimI-like enzyme
MTVMAARTDAPARASSPELLDLRRLSAADLRPLLEEETAAWRTALDWDFGKSAELVERFVDLHALNGHALVQGGEAVGYSYYVFEEQKGLVGDLYVRARFRTPEIERRLLAGVLESLIAARVRRIEAQLMMVEHIRRHAAAEPQFLTAFDRNFMVLEMPRDPLPAGRPRRRVYVERWADQHQEGAAGLIAAGYAGHVDSLINDQYRSLSGARRFLFNIVQYPGCGAFFRPASYAAFDAESGRICGICLASTVSASSGHITQICVTPWARGSGVGYELLRHSLQSLAQNGARRTSLTVTASNTGAVALYERIGFRTRRRFSAYVWEGF